MYRVPVNPPHFNGDGGPKMASPGVRRALSVLGLNSDNKSKSPITSPKKSFFGEKSGATMPDSNPTIRHRNSERQTMSQRKYLHDDVPFSKEFTTRKPFGWRGIISQKRGHIPPQASAFGVTSVLERDKGWTPPYALASRETGVIQSTRVATPEAHRHEDRSAARAVEDKDLVQRKHMRDPPPGWPPALSPATPAADKHHIGGTHAEACVQPSTRAIAGGKKRATFAQSLSPPDDADMSHLGNRIASREGTHTPLSSRTRSFARKPHTLKALARESAAEATLNQLDEEQMNRQLSEANAACSSTPPPPTTPRPSDDDDGTTYGLLVDTTPASPGEERPTVTMLSRIEAARSQRAWVRSAESSAAAEPAVATVDDEPPSPQAITAMTVAEMRAELALRGLSTEGLKPALVARLTSACSTTSRICHGRGEEEDDKALGDHNSRTAKATLLGRAVRASTRVSKV